MEEFQADLRTMEGKLDAIIEKFNKKHVEERFNFKEDPRDVPDHHIKWIRERRIKQEEMRERREREAVPETNVAGRSDEGLSYTMEGDDSEMNQPLPGMVGFWSSNHQKAMQDDRKLKELKKNRDPFPKAVSGKSDEHVVYVDITGRTRGGRRPGDDRGRGGGMPPVA